MAGKEIEFECDNCFYQHDKHDENSWGNHKFKTTDWHSNTKKEDNDPHGVDIVRVETECSRCKKYVYRDFSVCDFTLLMSEWVEKPQQFEFMCDKKAYSKANLCPKSDDEQRHCIWNGEVCPHLLITFKGGD